MTNRLTNLQVSEVSATFENIWEPCETHAFVTQEDGVDRCVVCGVTFLEHARGFGSNTTPRGFHKRSRKANDWTPPPTRGTRAERVLGT